jgi:hypothetical protein
MISPFSQRYFFAGKRLKFTGIRIGIKSADAHFAAILEGKLAGAGGGFENEPGMLE